MNWSKGFKVNAIASMVSVGMIFVGLAAKYYGQVMIYDWAKVTFWLAVLTGIVSTIVELVRYTIIDIKVRFHEYAIRRHNRA